jgi:hypothetical protein
MPSFIALPMPAAERPKREQKVTPLLPSVTKAALLLATMRLCVTFFVVTLTFPVVAADTLHPLSDAARRAVTLCTAVDAQSLDQCGTRMVGRSAAHSAARTAVKQYFDQLGAYMRTCGQQSQGCLEEAEWLTMAGMAAATQPASDH